MDVSRGAYAAAVLAVFCGLGGCANFQTIARSTALPLGGGKGMAVHLDAQQRLVVFTATRYCAEPSPDALAAYAAALGLSAPKLPSKALAASGAFNSAAGSIGLRTQSITLMRDTLYRICEERLNDALSDEQVAVLLARSQDLTAVILAIEQLTGAVAAPAVTLTTSGSSSALASLTANTEALAAAEKAETAAKSNSDKANGLRDDAQSDYDHAYETLETLKKASSPDTQQIEDQVKVVNGKDQLLQQAKGNAETAAKAYEQMHETKEQISQARDAATAVTTAAVSSGAQAGSFAQRNLSDQAVGEVSYTVSLLVTELLNKDYFMDTCLATLTSPGSRKAYETYQKKLEQTRAEGAKQTSADVLATKLQEAQGKLITTCLEYMSQIKPTPFALPQRANPPASGSETPRPQTKDDKGTTH